MRVSAASGLCNLGRSGSPVCVRLRPVIPVLRSHVLRSGGRERGRIPRPSDASPHPAQRVSASVGLSGGERGWLSSATEANETQERKASAKDARDNGTGTRRTSTATDKAARSAGTPVDSTGVNRLPREAGTHRCIGCTGLRFPRLFVVARPCRFRRALGNSGGSRSFRSLRVSTQLVTKQAAASQHDACLSRAPFAAPGSTVPAPANGAAIGAQAQHSGTSRSTRTTQRETRRTREEGSSQDQHIQWRDEKHPLRKHRPTAGTRGDRNILPGPPPPLHRRRGPRTHNFWFQSIQMESAQTALGSGGKCQKTNPSGIGELSCGDGRPEEGAAQAHDATRDHTNPTIIFRCDFNGKRGRVTSCNDVQRIIPAARMDATSCGRRNKQPRWRPLPQSCIG